MPPGDRLIVNEKLGKMPFNFIPPRFDGRKSGPFQTREKELEEIRSTLLPSQGCPSLQSHRCFLITGLGGAGKTELAFQFVTNFEKHFDAVFFLLANSESRLCEQYSTIALDLGLVDPSDTTDNQELCAETFRTWLADPVKAPLETQEAQTLVKWLLVFDNAEDPAVIRKFWPGGQSGSILLTTRNPRLASPELSIAGKMRLQGFSTVEGAQLLRRCAQDEKADDSRTEADAEAIVEWIQGLPLTIDRLGRLMRYNHLSVSKFRKICPMKSDVYGRLYNVDEKDGSLATVWGLNELYERQKDTFALLSLLAMLDPECIEDRTLKPRLNSLNADGSAMTLPQYTAYRTQLTDTPLIEVDRDTQAVSINRVVQDVTRSMAVCHGFAATAFNDAVNRVAEQWPFLNRNYKTGSATKVERWKDCHRTYRHILHLMVVHAELASLAVSSLAITELIELLLEAAQYRMECGVAHEATPLLDAAEKLHKLRGPNPLALDDEQVKIYRGRIGLAASSKNLVDLLHYAQLAWEIETARHRKIGHATSILAVAYNDLAVAWACHGEWEKAIELLQESRRIREKLPAFTRDMLFSPLYHLGLILHHQKGYDEAERVLNEAIKDREEALGLADAASLRSAALLYARGNVRLARADLRRDDIGRSLLDHTEAEARARRSTGAKNHPVTLLCRYQRARASANLGHYENACHLLQEILSIPPSTNRTLPPRDIARTSYLYAHCLAARGQTVESHQALLRSLEIHNQLRPQCQRTVETLTEEDIGELVPYDYL